MHAQLWLGIVAAIICSLISLLPFVILRQRIKLLRLTEDSTVGFFQEIATVMRRVIVVILLTIGFLFLAYGLVEDLIWGPFVTACVVYVVTATCSLFKLDLMRREVDTWNNMDPVVSAPR